MRDLIHPKFLALALNFTLNHSCYSSYPGHIAHNHSSTPPSSVFSLFLLLGVPLVHFPPNGLLLVLQQSLYRMVLPWYPICSSNFSELSQHCSTLNYSLGSSTCCSICYLYCVRHYLCKPILSFVKWKNNMKWCCFPEDVLCLMVYCSLVEGMIGIYYRVAWSCTQCCPVLMCRTDKSALWAFFVHLRSIDPLVCFRLCVRHWANGGGGRGEGGGAEGLHLALEG